MKLPLAPLVALLVACCSAQLSSDYLGMYNDYDLYGQGYGAEGYGQDYEDQPSDQKNSWNPYSAYYGDEYGDYFFKDPAEVAQDCTVGADGKVTFAGGGCALGGPRRANAWPVDAPSRPAWARMGWAEVEHRLDERSARQGE